MNVLSILSPDDHLVLGMLQIPDSAMALDPQIMNKQPIKPFSPTPFYLRNFRLSRLDQLAPVCYRPLLFFYSVDARIHSPTSVSERFQLLKRSLSETLTRFYPLAGRIREADASVECNDDGAVLVEAKLDCPLFSFLEKPDTDLIRKLIAVEIDSEEALFGCLLHVQITCFSCGGLAIGICISQKISDEVTVTTFAREWAAISSGRRSSQAVIPSIKASSIFPPKNLSFSKPPSMIEKELHVTKRLVFDSRSISALQAKSASEIVKQPTRVEAVTALIWKCAMNSSRSNRDHPGISILSQSVNLRRRMVPLMPENCIGNLAGHFTSPATECDQIELSSLVTQLRKGMQDFDKNYAKKLQGDDALLAIPKSCKEVGHLLEEGNIDFYSSTSLCRFPFYDIDFGWGKPAWVTIPSWAFKNVIVMVDTKEGDGIESWVTLAEEDMGFFEHDQELLAVASLNPRVPLPNPIMPHSSL